MLGFGKGDIKITLDKTSFQPGEIVRGMLLLTLKNPQNAKGVRVILRAERTVSRTVYSSGVSRSQNDTEILYQQEKWLDAEKLYPAAMLQYTFDFGIPNPLPFSQPGGFMRVFSGTGKPKWYIDAALDIPGGFDVSKKTEIKVLG